MCTRKKIALFIMVSISLFIFSFIEKAQGATVNDVLVEIMSDGKIRRGTPITIDKPIFRPGYQGNYQTLLKDIIGPEGEFNGFSDDTASTDKYRQKFLSGQTMVFKNLGSYQGKKVALKIISKNNLLRIGIEKEGTIAIYGFRNAGQKPVANVEYQLVYDEPNYPVVSNVYLDLPYMMTAPAKYTDPLPTQLKIEGVLKKYYLTLSNNAWDFITRKYSFVGNTFSYTADYGVGQQSYEHLTGSLITDNSQPTNINLIGSTTNIYLPVLKLFKPNQKSPYLPEYLPVRVNGLGNSNKFEANYDVAQTVTDAYPTFFPDSVKVVVEDKEGCFEKLDQKNFVFEDKDGLDITNLVNVEKISPDKLEISIKKASLEKLRSNQINIKIALSDLKLEKVLSNFDTQNNVYNVPLTFYNVRTKDGIEKKSEETNVNATITPNVYGEAKPTTVWVGTSTQDLNPFDLIDNCVSTIPNDTIKARFVEEKTFATTGIHNIGVELSSTVTPDFKKEVIVPITATKGSQITSVFFDNQTWIINELNRQLSPKKINTDVYESDLASITTIDIADGLTYPTEYIPTAIGKLENLRFLQIANLQLSRKLPTELGELSKLTNLSIYGNTFDGSIPNSIGKLKNLSLLALNDNQLRGEIPASIGALPKLEKLNVAKNPLSGQMPNFPENMKQFNISDTQVTYNLATIPSFITSASVHSYDRSFIGGLQLVGKARVGSQSTEIKPFNESDQGYFRLQALQDDSYQELVAEHSYTVRNALSNEVYYSGKKDSQVTIPYEEGMIYQVILDDAELNSRNVFSIQAKEDEFKFNEIPTALSFNSKLGATAQTVQLEGSLSIFDNRENKNWKLSITPSPLVAGTTSLRGEYRYTSKNGMTHSIETGQKFLLETGESDNLNEVIPVSKTWTDNYGLSYTAYQSNYAGEYTGSVNWTLEDAP